MENGMWKAALAGALMVVAAGALPASAGDKSPGAGHASSVRANPAIESRIAEAKAMLQLRPEQERHWPRIAAAIREWANISSAETSDDDGLIRRASAKAAAFSARAVRAKRVLSVAMPLIRTLDAEQKQTAAMLVRAMGLGHLAAAL
jgi:hypothetical protein